MSHNPNIQAYINTVEAVNDDELTVQELYDAYAESDGSMGDFNLALLANFAARAQEVVALAIYKRAAKVTAGISDEFIGGRLLAACLAERPKGDKPPA